MRRADRGPLQGNWKWISFEMLPTSETKKHCKRLVFELGKL